MTNGTFYAGENQLKCRCWARPASVLSVRKRVDSDVQDIIDVVQAGEADRVPIKDLLLDDSNPRFGELERGVEQATLVDLIVDKFDVSDLLSSLSMNGFFAAEPLVCTRRPDDSLVVREGNRRLCACIILTGDARAVRQEKLTTRFDAAWRANGSPSVEPVPVLVFDEHDAASEKMLSYLGVRHISAAQPWDSYAKASWVAKISESTNLPVSKISEMIGDQHSTVIRLLEGYRFVRQLIEADLFRPSDSQRRGRGSVTEYPFSWVYTVLGFRATRDFCGLGEISGDPQPIPEDSMENAATVLIAMFGNRSIGRSAAVQDSRQLSDLAKAFADPEKVALLRSGKDLTTVLDTTKPIGQKLEDNLSLSRDLLSDLASSVTETPPSADLAGKHLGTSNKTRALATDLARRLKDIADGLELDVG